MHAPEGCVISARPHLRQRVLVQPYVLSLQPPSSCSPTGYNLSALSLRLAPPFLAYLTGLNRSPIPPRLQSPLFLRFFLFGPQSSFSSERRKKEQKVTRSVVHRPPFLSPPLILLRWRT